MADELASALSEVIEREAHRKLRGEINEVFRDFEAALTELCSRYDAEPPFIPEFQERWRELKKRVFAECSESARLRQTEHFIRKVTSATGIG